VGSIETMESGGAEETGVCLAGHGIPLSSVRTTSIISPQNIRHKNHNDASLTSGRL